MATTTDTAEPVTVSDLEGHVRDIRGLSIALSCAIEGAPRQALTEKEAREALGTLAGTIAEQARSLEALWEQAFQHHNRERRRV